MSPSQAKRPSPNPYVFILGCPRSGTTLLQRVLDAHPQLAVVFETRWVANFYEKRKGLTPDGFITPRFVTRLIEHERFGRMGISRVELERLIGNGATMSYADFVSELFDRFAARQGKPLAGEKTPGYTQSIATLHGLWPRAKFVHLIRDGRDVCLSAVGWWKDRLKRDYPTWEKQPVLTVGLWWKRNVRLAREAGAELPSELYHEMRYEALVASPDRECQRLCDFLGLRYDDGMLRFHEIGSDTDPELASKQPWRPITPGLRDWTTQMSVEDVERFEAAAGDLLDELGYRRATRLPSAAAREELAAVQGVFERDVQARGRPLPERW